MGYDGRCLGQQGESPERAPSRDDLRGSNLSGSHPWPCLKEHPWLSPLMGSLLQAPAGEMFLRGSSARATR